MQVATQILWKDAIPSKTVNEEELIRCLAFISPLNSSAESKCLILTA